jgi:hypothetical protein
MLGIEQIGNYAVIYKNHKTNSVVLGSVRNQSGTKL